MTAFQETSPTEGDYEAAIEAYLRSGQMDVVELEYNPAVHYKAGNIGRASCIDAPAGCANDHI